MLVKKAKSAGEQNVLDFHRIGREAIKAMGKAPDLERLTFPKDLLATLLKPGIGESYIRKAAKFAAMYPREHLNRLLFRWEQAGARIGRGIIVELIQINDATERERFEKHAATQRWSVQRVKGERAKRFCKSDKGRRAGRRPKLAEGREQLVRQLRDNTERWLRYAATLTGRVQSQAKGQAAFAPALLRKLQAAQIAMTALQQAACKPPR